MKIQPYLFEMLKKQTGFLHGISPRFYLDAAGDPFPLRPGRVDLPGEGQAHTVGFLRSIGIRHEEIYFPRQVHGSTVLTLEEVNPKAESADADAVITALTGKPIGVMTADCVPVLLYDPSTPAIGVVHAGRRGTQERIVAKAIARLQRRFGVQPGSLTVAMGPSIGGCCYEVGADCLEPFKSAFAQWRQFSHPRPQGKYLLDLWRANQHDALAAGVRRENILGPEECTACNVDRWYSYRKEGATGRMITVAMLQSG